MAICGGVNSIMLPDVFIPLSKARMVSPTGASQAFSASADGYARGEGCGMIVLKRLSDALRSKDKIWGTIMTASNQDGHTASPITAPSSSQQTSLLEKAYRCYDINPCDVQYIEAHGTGTPVGDPIEANSLGTFFKSGERVLPIGSVKTNIGHLESAAGIAGVIKVLLMMKHATIVPILHFARVNPDINLQKLHLRVPVEASPWNTLSDGRRVACVNSFGFGGSNAHAIIMQGDVSHPQNVQNTLRHSIVTISGNSEEALKRNIVHLKEIVSAKNIDLESLSFTSTCRRDHHQYRIAVQANSSSLLIEKLKEALNRQFTVRMAQVNVIFVFGGMGTTWEGMCKNLLKTEETFLKTIRLVDDLLKEYCSVSVEKELESSSDLQDPVVGPLVIFATQVGLFKMWKEWGIEPDVCVGQSVGEVAAAHACGRLTLNDAVKIIYHRTKLLATVTGGKMLVIQNYSVSRVEELCLTKPGRVNIAVYYSPTSCSIAGEEKDVNLIKETLASEIPTVTMFWLNVTSAFHSHKMDVIVEPLINSISPLQTTLRTSPYCKIISTVTGCEGSDMDFVNPDYWSRNLRQPVLFYQAVREAVDQRKKNIFVEIGPKPVLKAHIDDIFSDIEVTVLASMINHSDSARMVSTLCDLYTEGVDPKWENIVPTNAALCEEPRYQFVKQKSLFDPAASRLKRNGQSHDGTRHPFVQFHDDDEETFTIQINKKQTQYVFEHEVCGNLVVQGAVYVEVGYAVGSKILRVPPDLIKLSLYFVKMFKVQTDQAYSLTCKTQVIQGSTVAFTVYDKDSVYAYGHAHISNDDICNVPEIKKIQERCNKKWSKSDLYNDLTRRRLMYGPDVAIVEEINSNAGECVCIIEASELFTSELFQTTLHPCILDAMAQVLCSMSDDEPEEPVTMLPSSIDYVAVFQTIPRKTICYVKMVEKTSSDASYNLVLLSLNRTVVAEVRGFTMKAMGTPSDDVRLSAFQMSWLPLPEMPESSPESVPKQVLLMGSRSIIKSCTSISDAFLPYETSAKDFSIEKIADAYFPDSACDRKVPSPNVSAIIFCQQENIPWEKEDVGDEYFLYNFKQHCLNLRDLIIFLSEKNTDIPLVVLTWNTQALYITKSRSFDIDLAGCQLWGMVRCILQEDIYPSIGLVDLGDMYPESIRALVEYVQTLTIDKNYLFNHKELLIKQGQLFSSVVQLCRGPEWENTTVRQKWDGMETVETVANSSQYFSETDLYLRHVKSELDAVASDKQNVKFNMDRYISHKNAFFPTTVGNLAKKQPIWKDVNDDNAVILTLEAEGFISGSGERSVVCFPMRVSSHVYVPTEVVLPMSSIPYYKPGILSLLTLVWYTREILKPKWTIGVVLDESSVSLGTLITNVLKLLGCKKTFTVTKENLVEMKDTEIQVLIILSDISDSILRDFLETRRRKCTVVVYEGLLSLSMKGINDVIITYALKPISISPLNVFTSWYLTKTLPLIHCFVQKEQKKFELLLKGLNGYNMAAAWSFNGVRDFCVAPASLVETSKHSLFRQNASYLVVGGLGGLGWITVRLIAEMGGGLVATVSRRLPSEDMNSKIEELQQSFGIKVVCLQADVTDVISLSNAVQRLSNAYPNYPVRGIFHGAGVLDDTFLINMSEDQLERVNMPKVMGTYNLHKISKNLHLDIFMLHSSVVSIAGNAGQSNYGAGNSFMDTFAHYRRQKNLPAQSINWGPLETGMALSNQKIAEQLRTAGYIPLSEEKIKLCLVHAMLNNAPQICYMDVDWNDKHKHILLADDIRKVMVTRGLESDKNYSKLDIDIEMYVKDSPAARYGQLIEYMRQLLATVLAMDPGSLQEDTDLLSLGLDSMLSMTISNQLRRDLFVKITLTELLQSKSLKSLVIALDMKITGNIIETIDQFEEPLTSSDNKDEISPFQVLIYQNHRRFNGQRDVIYVVDVSITLSVPMTLIEETILSLVKKNSQLRTFYKERKASSITAWVLQDVTSDMFVSVYKQEPKDFWEELRMSACHKLFDLTRDAPFRVLCVQSPEGYRLGFVFHQICFDLGSMQIFFQEFSDILKSGGELHRSPTTNIDLSAEINIDLKPRLSELAKFWESKLKIFGKIPVISFSQSNPEVAFGVYKSVKEEISTRTFSQMGRLLHELQITMFQLLTSSYQLLLHVISKEQIIALTTPVDVRLHIPRLREVISRFANRIPIVTKINPNHSIQSFLTSNCREVAECVFNGLYPEHLITNYLPEKNASVFRHAVAFEDMTEFQALVNKYKFDHKLDILHFGSVQTRYETRLVIWFNKVKKSLTLQLEYLPTLLTEVTAKAILESVHKLVEWIVNNKEKLICDIPDNVYKHCHDRMKQFHSADRRVAVIDTTLQKRDCCFKNAIIDSLEFVKSGCTFHKLTRLGRQQVVSLSVGSYDGCLSLQWRELTNHRTKRLPLNKLMNVTWKNVFGHQLLIVKTRSRRLYFKATEDGHAKAWMTGFRDALQKKSGFN